MLGWDQYEFDKKCTGTRFAELVFLNPVGYMVHVVHSNAPKERIIEALFFMLGWARCGFHQKHTWTLYAELIF
jgi:hypothetical protein